MKMQTGKPYIDSRGFYWTCVGPVVLEGEEDYVVTKEGQLAWVGWKEEKQGWEGVRHSTGMGTDRLFFEHQDPNKQAYYEVTLKRTTVEFLHLTVLSSGKTNIQEDVAMHPHGYLALPNVFLNTTEQQQGKLEVVKIEVPKE